MHSESSCDLMPWDEETYKQIPMDRVIFRHLARNPVPEEAFDTIRGVFLKHHVQRSFALCVIHRHFDLAPAERLVEFNNVSAPWRVSDSPDYLQPGIQAKNWAFIDGKLFPYEFKFDPSVSEPHEPPPSGSKAMTAPPSDFTCELREVLQQYGLQSSYGIGTLDADDLDMTTPSKFEFTAGRTSVVVPMTKEMESMARVEASWQFPCANPYAAGFSDGEPVKTRFCNLTCRGHVGD